MNERAVFLNQLAQGRRPMDRGAGWFTSLADTEQTAVLEELAEWCVQARATGADGRDAIPAAGIKPTYTPAVLIVLGDIRVQLRKIVALPRDERVKSFRLLVALLGVADARRRKRFCAHGCAHAWHQLANVHE